MEVTKNLQICKPDRRWLDRHPGCGEDGLVSEMLDNVDEALSAGGQFKTLSVPLSSAQLLAMKATPVVLFPAMPSVAVVPLAAALQYIPVTVDYALGNATLLYIGSAVNPISVTNVLQPITATVLDGSSGPGNVLGFFPTTNPVTSAQSWFGNQSLVITHNGSAELTLGNGTAVVSMTLLLANL